jgi:flavin reductase (DIM6/NTAB) family NADH-FMN oxidoreductase RutF
MTMKQSLGAKTILCPVPVLIVGSFDENDRANIMTASWGGICCSEPPCAAVSIRRDRHTFAGIVKHEAFTINVPSAAQVREADYVGIYSGRDEDKFAALNLTAVRSDLVDAPYVEEFPLVLECALRHTIELGVHTQFIGEILDAKVEADVLDKHGRLDVAALRPFVYAAGEGSYWAVGETLGRSYTIGKK